MHAKCDLTVVVLTLDEERHIGRCLESVVPLASRIVVVDSGSTDRTRAIARDLGADVLEHAFVSHGKQLNWALDNAGIATTWVMKLDADEYVTDQLADRMRGELAGMPAHVSGITLNLRRIFMGRWLRHGGLYPLRLLRIWRFGRGRCEERWMDEHITVEGSIRHLDADFADHNLNSVSWWTDKHNRYASREAVDVLLKRRAATVPDREAAMGARAARTRWLKHHLYARMPLGFRAVAYFLYRYFARLGFLDGWQGFVFHFLQGCWYRVLVDVKIREVESALQNDGTSLEDAVFEVLGIRLAG